MPPTDHEMSSRFQPCDACQSTSFVVLSRTDRRSNALTTVVCRTCGLVSHESIPTEAELTAYYEREYRQDYHGEYAPSPHRVMREWTRGKGLRNLLQPYLQPAAKVMEVGAGIGCTVKQFELAGFRATGVEPGEGFQQYSQRELKAQVEQAFLEDLSPTQDQDLVMLVHVLEHLPRPTEALNRLRMLLKPGGLLYIEVPNFAAPHAAPGKQFHYAHIYNYTPATLAMVAQKCGFAIEQSLSPSHDKNLKLLLRRTDEQVWTIDEQAFAHSLEAAYRYNLVSYHLRWRYVVDRLRSVSFRWGGRIGAKGRLQRVLRQIQEHPKVATRAA